jgi:hypothetical protein
MLLRKTGVPLQLVDLCELRVGREKVLYGQLDAGYAGVSLGAGWVVGVMIDLRT